MTGSTLPPDWRDIVIKHLRKKNYLKDMRTNNSPLSTVSHLATNQSRNKQTEKETLPTEAAKKYWESVIRQTSVEKTTSSNAKDEQTNHSP